MRVSLRSRGSRTGRIADDCSTFGGAALCDDAHVQRPSLSFVVAAAAAVVASAVAGSADGAQRARPRPYPVHTNITATVFWVGEPVGNGSSENNALSAYDDLWESHYGGYDDYRTIRRPPYFPPFPPRENPFYLDLPYSDFTDAGDPRAERERVVPWAKEDASALAASRRTGRPFSLMKNRWVRIWRLDHGKPRTCYGQIEDAGPYVYDDVRYVFGRHDERPRSRLANNAGMDVSPALRDCLGFAGVNDDVNTVSWQFVDRAAVPPGPWRRIVTTRQVFWR